MEMNKTKSARQWFEGFPEPYRTQALENAEGDRLKEGYLYASTALYLSFSWEDSPQDGVYWLAFYKELLEQEQK